MNDENSGGLNQLQSAGYVPFGSEDEEGNGIGHKTRSKLLICERSE